MSEEEGKKKEEQANADGNQDQGNKSETAKETKRIRAETEELEKAIAEKGNADARAKIAGVVVAGQKKEEEKEETNHEYRLRIEKELREGKHNAE